MNSLSIDIIYIFLSVMDTRSATETAKVLNISTPSVSRALNKMREAHKNPIFIRTRHGLEPTALAMNMTPHLSQALFHMESAMKATIYHDNVSNNEPPLRICSPTEMEFFLTNLFSDKRNYNFGYEFISQDFPYDLIKERTQLRTQRIDFILSPDKYNDWAIDSVPLFGLTPVILCRNKHPRIDSTSSMKDIYAEDYLSYSQLSRFFNGNDLSLGFERQPIYKGNSLINLLMIASETDYLILCAKELIGNLNCILGLQVIPLHDENVNGFIYAHFNKQRMSENKIKCFLNMQQLPEHTLLKTMSGLVAGTAA